MLKIFNHHREDHHMNGLKIGALLCALLIMAAPAAAEKANINRDDYIRLHVVADDDTALKQGVKLAVRDGVRCAANALLSGCGSSNDAFDTLAANVSVLEAAAQAVLDDWGDQGGVSVETGVFAFPDRQYGDLFLPAGDYRAVRVVLGRGAGHNWWCVLYPSLCLNADTEAEQTVMFYSSIARWLSALFGGEKHCADFKNAGKQSGAFPYGGVFQAPERAFHEVTA